ncbi:MAG: (d)CMP kinase [Candidatus Rokuibacteriota bacterium]
MITIDGPAGAGKSTVARLLALQLGLAYVDSGSLYRAVTWLLQEHGAATEPNLSDAGEEDVLRQVQDPTKLELRNDPEGSTRLYFDHKDISVAIRSSRVETLVPFVARRRRVREAITAFQRRLVSNKGAVVEGRDVGTVVFPDAPLKFFLTASIKSRAQRRFLELRRKNDSKPLADCIRDIEARDELDRTREVAPLLPAPDAVVVDTSGYTVGHTLEALLEHVIERFPQYALVRPYPSTPPVTLIAVAGPIGVGKSTFCEWLGRNLSVPVFAENPDENPYIHLYYSQPDRWALHSQMWFLYRKHELLISIGDQKTTGIIDRTLHEDYMFARVLSASGRLSESDLELYEHWYRLVFSLVPQPTVVVSLEASTETLRQRIADRARPYEKTLDRDFLDALNREYNAWITEYTDAPVIRVNTETTDVRQQSMREEILARVHETLGAVEMES